MSFNISICQQKQAQQEKESLQQQVYEQVRRTRVEKERAQQAVQVQIVIILVDLELTCCSLVGYQEVALLKSAASEQNNVKYPTKSSRQNVGTKSLAAQEQQGAEYISCVQYGVTSPHPPARNYVPLNQLSTSLRAQTLAARYDAEDVGTWDEHHVAIFLDQIGLAKYAPEFLEEAIDGQCL